MWPAQTVQPNPGNRPLEPRPTLPVSPRGGPLDSPFAPWSPTGDLDRDTWSRWWEHNGEVYLALKAARQRLSPATPGSGDDAIDPMARRRPGLTWTAVYGEVVPAMLKELEKGEDVRLVGGLLLALARIGEAPDFAALRDAPVRAPAIAPVLIAHLSHGNRDVAETAVIALGVLGSTEAVVHLADLAHDSTAGRRMCRKNRVSVRMRALAAYGLGIAGSHLDRYEVSRFAVHHLSQVLEEGARKHEDLHAACVIALGMVRLDPTASPDGGAVNAEWPGSSAAAQIEHLLGLLVSEKSPPMVRAHVPTALGRVLVGAPAEMKDRVAAVLIDLATPGRERDADVRRSCVIALGLIGDRDEDATDKAIRAVLVEAVKDHDAMGRAFAVLSLAQTTTRPGHGVEVPPASDEEVVAFLVRQLSRGKSLLKPWAGLALGIYGHGLRQEGRPLTLSPESALSFMVRSARNPDTAVACALGAGLAGDVEVRREIESMLLDNNIEAYRGPLAISLGFLGDPASIPALKQAMADALHKPLLMEQAAIGRALLADRDLQNELLERLAESDCWASTWGATRALAWTADYRALRPLLDLLRDHRRSEPERGLAAEALGWIADKDLLPWDTRISTGLNYTVAPETLTDPVGLGVLDTR